MSATANHFRTTVFGGFHKQDVMDYITAATKKNQAQKAELTQRAEQAARECQAMQEKYRDVDAVIQEKTKQCEQLSDDLALKTSDLERTERELAMLKDQYEQALLRLNELQILVPQLQEDAAGYAALKDHTATIELEAHRKAVETVDNAKLQEAQIRDELMAWLSGVQEHYQCLRTNVVEVVSRLTQELEQGKQSLENSSLDFLQNDAAMNGLSNYQWREGDAGAPEPLVQKEEEGAEICV